MANRSFLQKMGNVFLDLFEIYIPAVAFIIMFITFVIEVGCRYFLNYPITWAYELTVFGFIWTVILGAAYATRTSSHVVFDLVYERLSPRGQLIMRLCGNTLIVAAFGLSVPASYQYIQFMGSEKSSVLSIPFNLGFAPYIVFLLIVLGRTGCILITDLRKLWQGVQ